MKDINFTVIKDKEFAVLCALSDIQHFYGSMDLKKQALSKQEIYTILYGLYRKELVSYEGERIVLSPDMAEVLRLLKEAKRMLSFVNPMNSENHAFYFRNEGTECVNLQKNWEEPDSIRMRKVSKQEILPICEKEELLPKQILDEQTMQHISINNKGQVTKEYLEISLYDMTDEKQLATVNVRMEGLNEVLVYSSETDSYKENYLAQHLKELVETFVQEEAVR